MEKEFCRDMDSSRPDVDITPEMIAAGVGVLWDERGIVGPYAAEELAEAVFRAMTRAKPPREN